MIARVPAFLDAAAYGRTPIAETMHDDGKAFCAALPGVARVRVVFADDGTSRVEYLHTREEGLVPERLYEGRGDRGAVYAASIFLLASLQGAQVGRTHGGYTVSSVSITEGRGYLVAWSGDAHVGATWTYAPVGFKVDGSDEVHGRMSADAWATLSAGFAAHPTCRPLNVD